MRLPRMKIWWLLIPAVIIFVGPIAAETFFRVFFARPEPTWLAVAAVGLLGWIFITSGAIVAVGIAVDRARKEKEANGYIMAVLSIVALVAVVPSSLAAYLILMGFLLLLFPN